MTDFTLDSLTYVYNKTLGYIDEEVEQILLNEKENFKMETLEKWEEKNFTKLDEVYNDAREIIRGKDDTQSKLKDTYVLLKTMGDETNNYEEMTRLKKIVWSLKTIFSTKTKDTLNKLDIALKSQKNLIRERKLEVESLIKDCDTYEQKVEFLKSYNIIDDCNYLTVTSFGVDDLISQFDGDENE